MPDIDGYDFSKVSNLSGLANRGCVSHRDDCARQFERSRAGFDCQVAKPIDPTELVRMVVNTRAEKAASVK
jgi:hypothetical protein